MDVDQGGNMKVVDGGDTRVRKSDADWSALTSGREPRRREQLRRSQGPGYEPFGECRNSQGTVPTDKLFTGQRLDETGLYFYNARYYDPAIGRFISPDFLIQSPADPQTLNRYSYVANNPLRYADSTGNWFEFAGSEKERLRMYETLMLLYHNTATHDLVVDLMTDENKVVTLQFGGSYGGAGGQTLPTDYAAAVVDTIFGASVNIDWTITIDQGATAADVAPLLAHELSHAAESRLSDSVQEEVIAYQFADKVSGNPGPFSGLDPDKRADLVTAQDRLGNLPPPLYDALHLYPASNRWEDLYYASDQALNTMMPYKTPGDPWYMDFFS